MTADDLQLDGSREQISTYSLSVRRRDEAREDAIIRSHTWLVEGALSNRVILGIKIELDGVALGSGNIFRIKDQFTPLADIDGYLGSEGEGEKDERQKDSGIHG